MDPRWIIVLLGFLALLLIGLGWVWMSIRHQIARTRELQAEVAAILEDRRDVIPYLIESYRAVGGAASPEVAEIISVRAQARESRQFSQMWAREEEMESLLTAFFEQVKGNPTLQKDIGWLEARTELENAWGVVEKKEEVLSEWQTALDRRLAKFPFALLRGLAKK